MRTKLWMWMISWIVLLICWIYSIHAMVESSYSFLIYVIVSGVSIIGILQTTRVVEK